MRHVQGDGGVYWCSGKNANEVGDALFAVVAIGLVPPASRLPDEKGLNGCSVAAVLSLGLDDADRAKEQRCCLSFLNSRARSAIDSCVMTPELFSRNLEAP